MPPPNNNNHNNDKKPPPLRIPLDRSMKTKAIININTRNEAPKIGSREESIALAYAATNDLRKKKDEEIAKLKQEITTQRVLIMELCGEQKSSAVRFACIRKAARGNDDRPCKKQKK